MLVDDRAAKPHYLSPFGEVVHQEGVEAVDIADGDVDEEVVAARHDVDREHFGECHREGLETLDNGPIQGTDLRGDQGLHASVELPQVDFGVEPGDHDSWRDGVADAQRLAAAMAEKCALNGLAYGGGKTMVPLAAGPPPAGDHRRDLLLDIGDAVTALGGRYATGPDVGTTPVDMSVIGSRTSHVFCRPVSHGGSGDSSGPTSEGVLSAIRALAAHQQLRFSTAAIVGLGGVGLRVARGLTATGTRLFAADIDERRRRDAEQLGAAWLPAAEALRAEVDLLVLAATGGMITRDLVAQMRCRCVLGPANNQLDDPETAEELYLHGITWVPDTIVSAGGVIHAVAIERERATAQQAHQRVMAIGDTLTAVLTEARSRSVSPARAARERAFTLMTRAARPGHGAAAG